jgi:hypothetical protein
MRCISRKRLALPSLRGEFTPPSRAHIPRHLLAYYASPGPEAAHTFADSHHSDGKASNPHELLKLLRRAPLASYFARQLGSSTDGWQAG